MLVPPARRAAIRRSLLVWYDAGHRDLPWRFPQGAADPYRVWLAEVMLQQTRAASVAPYYRRFLERWPTLEALAAAPEEEVLAAFSGLGYYARCRNLVAAARAAAQEHRGLPPSIDGLRALPGFGRYTAGAVASMGFGIPAPAVDGNAARVLARLFFPGAAAAGAGAGRLWALAGELVPRRRPGDFNQALMELGATVCHRAAPACGRCPVAGLCAARRARREREVPPPRRRPARARLAVACALVERGGAILLARRSGPGLFAGLWELPGAEVAPGAPPAEALDRALPRRLGTAVEVAEELARLTRILTHRELELVAFRCRVAGEPRPAGLELRWAAPRELGALAMATAMRRLVEKARPGAGLEPPPRTADRPAGPPRPGRRPRRERSPSA